MTSPLLDLRAPGSGRIDAIESEQAVIGAVIYRPGDCAEALERLRIEHFAEPTHADLWAELRDGRQSDPVILAARLGNHPGLEGMGGVGYLAAMVDKALVHTVPAHVDAILDAAMRREIEALARWASSEAGHAGKGEKVLAAVERGCADIARSGAGYAPAQSAGLTALANIDAAAAGLFAGVPTGLATLDSAAGGVHDTDVWIVGGRSSMGKSLFGLNIARGLAQRGAGVLVVSLEMPLREVQARLIADLAYEMHGGRPNPYFGSVLRGRLSVDMLARARESARHLAELQISVIDTGGLTIEDIRRQSLQQVRAWEKGGIKPGAVVIDHLGLVAPVRKTDNKAADTSDTVNELKGLAKQLRCPIIALAQVNRGPENRNDKRPTMGDLNWSGSIEQIADLVVLLYRPAYYAARSSDPVERSKVSELARDLECIIAKNRSGPSKTLKLWCDEACGAVRDRPGEEGEMI